MDILSIAFREALVASSGALSQVLGANANLVAALVVAGLAYSVVAARLMSDVASRFALVGAAFSVALAADPFKAAFLACVGSGAVLVSGSVRRRHGRRSSRTSP